MATPLDRPLTRGGAFGGCCGSSGDAQGDDAEISLAKTYNTSQGGGWRPPEDKKPRKQKSVVDLLEAVTVKYKTAQDAPILPPRASDDNKPTLVLDMDETLIAVKFDLYLPGSDYIVPLRLCHLTETGTGMTELYTIAWVRKRPYLEDFLASVAKDWEVIIMTAGIEDYAKPIIAEFDRNKIVSYSLYRDSCSCDKSDGIIYKDLSILGRDVNRTVIVDNTPTCYKKHPENAIPISTWESSSKDRALRSLIPILQELSRAPNIVKALKRMRLNEF
ncbi:Nuclear LIM interactor-interacting factor 1 [Giardia duodenalis]|uniref:Mitochondrial import inner membrane translocase subunit TIM50 n=1 Tax=Giardia intestinalis TaxID=5741 RepID=V6TLR6_GIAIN|nr:Nuclear LIM interactor-interacting factor 1 [Giardia intestinalis]